MSYSTVLNVPQTLDTLRDTLSRRMSRDALDRLLLKLKVSWWWSVFNRILKLIFIIMQNSIVQVPQEAQNNVISVVRSKIGDTAYWLAYAKNM